MNKKKLVKAEKMKDYGFGQARFPKKKFASKSTVSKLKKYGK